MGRFLAYLFVFVLGGIIGTVGGGLIGGVSGSYLGACKVIDTAVEGGTITQEQANGLIKSIANDIDVHAGDKERITSAMKRANQPPSPCATAIDAL